MEHSKYSHTAGIDGDNACQVTHWAIEDEGADLILVIIKINLTLAKDSAEAITFVSKHSLYFVGLYAVVAQVGK